MGEGEREPEEGRERWEVRVESPRFIRAGGEALVERLVGEGGLEGIVAYRSCLVCGVA